MIKTITATTLRIEAIKDQFSYALKIIYGMKIDEIALYLREIEARNISQISFHGLVNNSFNSKEDIFFYVDWYKHQQLINTGELNVSYDDTFEDKAAPETVIECYHFKENCNKKGLKIEMRVKYSDFIYNDSLKESQLDKRLGLRTVTTDEKINFEKAAYQSEINLRSMSELFIRRRTS